MIRPLMAALLMATPAIPAAPTPGPCITREQVADITITLLPYFMESARTHCGPHLPSSAFILTSGGANMAAALRSVAASRKASAVAGFRIMAGGNGLRGMSEDTVIHMMGEGIAGELMPSFDARACGDFNDFVEAVSPLSPERLGRLAGVAFAIGIAHRHHREAAGEATSTHSRPEICQP